MPVDFPLLLLTLLSAKLASTAPVQPQKLSAPLATIVPLTLETILWFVTMGNISPTHSKPNASIALLAITVRRIHQHL